jgi:alpha-ketoglutarate-dependent taurine dioxygenase
MTITADARISESTVTIHPLQPTIGAEISGVDLREPLSRADRDAIKAALLEYKVVFFREQHLNREQHAAFAEAFGPLYLHPSTSRPDEDNLPAVHRISAVEAKDLYKDFKRTLEWDPYHSDTSWRLDPTWGAVLRAVDLPEVGGDTIWVDAGLALELLPADVRDRLEGRYVVHDFRDSLNRGGNDYPIVSHPVIRKHRETGNDILWVNFTLHPWIIGLDHAESDELLRVVHDIYRKPENQVRFSWRPGSIAFWDNRATMHYAVRNYGDYPRVLERILIADEPAFADI